MGIRDAIGRRAGGGRPDDEAPGTDEVVRMNSADVARAESPSQAEMPSTPQSPARLAYDAVTDLVDRRPGLFLRWLGILVVLGVLAVRYLEWRTVEPVEFVASLAAGVAILLFGTIIDLSADRLRGKETEARAEVEVAKALGQEPSRR